MTNTNTQDPYTPRQRLTIDTWYVWDGPALHAYRQWYESTPQRSTVSGVYNPVITWVSTLSDDEVVRINAEQDAWRKEYYRKRELTR